MKKTCKQCKNSFETNGRALTCSPPCKKMEDRLYSYIGVANFDQIKDALLNRTTCQICSKDFGKMEPVVDHCHKTNTFRGLLCRNCNTGLGLIKTPEDLQKAREYVLRTETDSPSHEIVRIMTKSYDRGWISSKDGNASILKGNKFYITPSGVTKYKMDPNSVIIGSRENGEIILPEGKPSGELMMHLALYQDPSVCAVLHLHPTYTIAALHAGINLHDLENDFAEINRFMRVAPNIPAIAPISMELADATKKALLVEPKFDIVGQTAHGVCAVGKTLSECFEHVERLEHICQIVLASGVKPNDKNRIL